VTEDQPTQLPPQYAPGEVETRRYDEWAAKGLFAAVVEEQVTYVNAPLLAKERGVEVTQSTTTESPDYHNLVSLRGALPDGRAVSVSGTLTAGPRETLKLTEVDGYDLDLAPEGHLLFFRYADRPGIVGTVGAILGDAGVNIAGMQVARREAGGEALMALAVDSAPGTDLLAAAGAAIGATTASRKTLPGAGKPGRARTACKRRLVPKIVGVSTDTPTLFAV